jgi:hypothetical protein
MIHPSFPFGPYCRRLCGNMVFIQRIDSAAENLVLFMPFSGNQHHIPGLRLRNGCCNGFSPSGYDPPAFR